MATTTTDTEPIEGMDRIEAVLAQAFRGIHHVPYWHKRRPCGGGLAVTVPGGMSTFDFEVLTRLVVSAHDNCVRVEIEAGGPRQLKLLLHARHGREGQIWSRHPTIEEAIHTARRMPA